MNEAAFDQVFPSSSLRTRIFGTSENRKSGAFYGYSLVTLALGVGWLLRERNLVNAEHGLGYWLGIIGGTMMLLLLLYPVRKRIRALRFLGGTTQWFRLHMILGLLGPLLVLYHSNFQVGSFNSQVALYCMLLVAGSGVIGRHLYAGIHQGLYGQKTSLKELRQKLNASIENNKGLGIVMPTLAARVEALAAELQGDSISGSLSIVTCIQWSLRKHLVRFSLWRTAGQELRRRAAESATVARDYRRMRKSSSKFIRVFAGMASNVARFTLYEKLFSLWHVLHLPLFFMLIVSALVHVLAVHMY